MKDRSMMLVEGREKKKSRRSLVLCDEITVEILIPLHPKTLIRCKLVCKRWDNLISDESFVKRFRSLPSLPPLLVGFLCNNDHGDRKPVKFHNLDSKSNDDKSLIDGSLGFLKTSARVVSSHNGLLLCRQIVDQNYWNYIVCNLLIRQSLTLPKRHPHPESISPLLVSNKNGGFKVVLFSCCEKNFTLLRTYSSDHQTWRDSWIAHNLGRFSVNRHYILSERSVYLWDERKKLCLFNLEEESMHAVDLPKNDRRDSARSFCGVSAGYLFYTENNSTCFRVWALDDRSKWSLKHNIKYTSLMPQFPKRSLPKTYFSPIAFHPLRPELLFVKFAGEYYGEFDDELFLYDMNNRSVEYYGNKFPRCDASVISYILPSCQLL